MFCKNCGNKLEEGAKFCGKCGNGNGSDEFKLSPSTVEKNEKAHKSMPIIRCGSCEYIGPGEPARTLMGKILAWLCIIFAPIITIIYFAATHKYKCPKCQSTFLGIKNEHGVYVGQKGSNAAVIFICILVGVAIIGILASVVLASLNSARQKGADAAIKANLANARAKAELYYDANDNSYDRVCISIDGVLPMKDAVAEISGGNVVCNDTKKAWAMSAPLKGGNYWCVDNLGSSEEVSEGIMGTQTFCSTLTSNGNSDVALTGYEVCAQDIPNSTWDGKSYMSDGNYECSCKDGYTYSSTSNKCVTNNQGCHEAFPNTSYKGVDPVDGRMLCDCKAGYSWNNAGTACY